MYLCTGDKFHAYTFTHRHRMLKERNPLTGANRLFQIQSALRICRQKFDMRI